LFNKFQECRRYRKKSAHQEAIADTLGGPDTDPQRINNELS